MGLVVEYVQNLWPFSVFVFNDLTSSDRIVSKLRIPESTKRFVYAIREPESQAIIYVLSVQNLSERSALDAEYLIKEIKPDAVVVQVGHSNDFGGGGLQNGGTELKKNCTTGDGENVVIIDKCSVPTSSFQVLKNCFMHKINRERYEDIAGRVVLREIFGVSFNEHFVAAQKAANEVGSSFFVLESPFRCSTAEVSECSLDKEMEAAKLSSVIQNAFGLQTSNLVPGRMGSMVTSANSRVFCVTDDVQSQMVKSLSSYLVQLNPISKVNSGTVQPLVDYDVPEFAQSVYPLLLDLHDIFVEIPSMKTALACAQKMLCDVKKGETIDTRLLSEVYAFQIAVEGIRIALNNASRISLGKLRNPANDKFSELPLEEKWHAILAQALRSQTKQHKSLVAVVDASALAGLRKHWKTDVPMDVKSMVEQLITDLTNEDNPAYHSHRKRLLADKPVVAVGAGATAILGASSLSKVIPASNLVKIATFHIPSSLKLMFAQTQKAIFFAYGKAFGPTKVMAHGMASSTLKSSTVKAAASAEKIRLVAHSMIASAEKTSLSAMRTAFYEIMRKRKVRPMGALPWATFGCSIATCAGLLVYGDGIECVAEALPAAPSIASLGRGIRNLHEASLAVKQAESSRIQKSIESLLYKFKNIKIQ